MITSFSLRVPTNSEIPHLNLVTAAKTLSKYGPLHRDQELEPDPHRILLTRDEKWKLLKIKWLP